MRRRDPAAVRRLLELFPEPAALLDDEGGLVALNAALAGWLGRDAALPCGDLRFADLVCEPDREAVAGVLPRLGPEPVAIDCRLPSAAGGVRPVEALFADRRGAAPLRGVLVTLRDQTARRAQERLLADSQLRLDLAIWGSDIGVWENDLVADDTRWLTAWCESLDLAPCDGPDHVARWDSLIHPEDRARAVAAYDAGLAGTREYYEAEYRYARRSGGWCWIRERGRVVERAADGRPLRVIGICVDIDAPKRAEEALQRVQSRLDLALEAARLPVWDWDVREGTWRVDRPRGPALVEPRLARVNPADAPRVLAALDEAVSGGLDTFEVEYRTRAARGEWKWVLDRGRVTEREAGAVVRVRGVTIDVDDRKRLEGAVLDAVNREQQRLGRELHDGLSQELTGASLLLTPPAARPNAADGVREALAIVQRAIDTSRRIAQGLSSLSTLHGGLEDALAQLVARLDGAGDARVRFARRIEAPIRLEAVQVEHLYRIAAEAATNALRHAQPSAVLVELEVARDAIRIAVGDDGRGIGSSRVGAGLGTRIMKYRADVLGGRLRIAERSPRGTLVECLCPNREAAPA